MSRTLTCIFHGDIFVLIIISFSSIVVQAPVSSTFVSCRQRDTDDFDSLPWPEASGIDNHRLCSRFMSVYFFFIRERRLEKHPRFALRPRQIVEVFVTKRTQQRRILFYASIASRLCNSIIIS